MDPDLLVLEIRELAEELASNTLHHYQRLDDSVEMAYKFQQLDAWMTAGGFRPPIWDKEKEA